MSYDTVWHYVGETGKPAFEDSWEGYLSSPLRFMKGVDGIVRIQGDALDLTDATNIIFILPEGYRPDEYVYNNVRTTEDINSIRVLPSGNVEAIIKPAGHLSINMSFYVGPIEYPTIGEKGDKGDPNLPSGSIMAWPTTMPPLGWAICNHQELDRVSEAGLFAVIGTDHGIGDGVDTFNVPDYRGLFLRGAGEHGTLNKANGNSVDGSSIGDENVDQMFGHKHILGVRGATNANLEIGHAAVNSIAGKASDGNLIGYSGGSTVNNLTVIKTPITDGVNGNPNTGKETYPSHGVINWIIKL